MSVTKEDMMEQFKSVEFMPESSSLHVNDSDMSQFNDQNKKLAKKIADLKLKYEVTHGLKSMPAYEELEEKCQISISTMKKTISLKIKPTRSFLYKLAVGLHLSLEEANDLFILCGGPLTKDCQADKICMFAIRDGDDIYHFIEQFESYTHIKIALRDRNSCE